MGKQQLRPLVQSRGTPRSWSCWRQKKLTASINTKCFMYYKRGQEKNVQSFWLKQFFENGKVRKYLFLFTTLIKATDSNL